MFTGVSGINQAMAASYSLKTHTYNWARVFQDQANKTQEITGLALNAAQTLLVLAGESAQGSGDRALFLFFVDPSTGGQLFSAYKVKFKENIYLQSSRSILLAGESRVYVTGRSWYAKKSFLTPEGFNSQSECPTCYNTDETDDTIQLLIFDYKTGNTLKNYYSSKADDTGPGTSVSLMDFERSTSTNNGDEDVRFLAGYSGMDNQKWMIGGFKIDPKNFTISGQGFKYKNGNEYFTESHSYQFPDAYDFSLQSKMLYFSTSSRQQSAGFPGLNSLVCSVKLKDSSNIFDENGIKCWMVQKSLLNDWNPQFFYTALKFYQQKVHVIFQYDKRTGLLQIGDDSSQLIGGVSGSSTQKAWAAAFGLSKTETYKTTEAPNEQYTVLQSYIAGQSQRFIKEENDAQVFHGFGEYAGVSRAEPRSAATIDALLKSETCGKTQSKIFAGVQLQNIITGSTTLTQYGENDMGYKVKNDEPPEAVKHKAYDLDYSKRLPDDLCNTFEDASGQPIAYQPESSFINDITLYLGDQKSYRCPVPQFTIQQTCSDPVKFQYAIDEQKISQSESNSNFFSLDTGSNQMIVQVLDSTAQVKNHWIKYIGTTPSGHSAEQLFKLILKAGPAPAGYDPCLVTCVVSSDNLVLNAGQQEENQIYILGKPQASIVVQQMSVNTGAVCKDTDIVYSMSVSPSQSGWITFDATTRKVSWQTSTPSSVNTYKITIQGTVARNGGAKIATTEFSLEVSTCSLSSDNLRVKAGAALPKAEYVIGASAQPQSATFNQMAESQGAWCQDSDITYSCEVLNQNGASAGPEFTTTFDQTTRIFSWAAATSASAGTWTIKMTGKITRSSVIEVSDISEFFLTIKVPCVKSTDDLEIRPAATVSDQTYQVFSQVGDSVTIPRFRITQGTHCTQNDIFYELNVTPPAPFVSYDSATEKASWGGATATDTNEYKVTLIGKIKRDGISDTVGQVEFILKVIVTCYDSIDAVTIAKGSTVPHQTYQLFWDKASVQTLFSLSSLYCSSNDLVVSLIVSSDNDQSTSFINRDDATGIVSWYAFQPSQVGEYVVAVSAYVRRSSGLTESSYQFILSVVPVPVDVNQPPVLQKLHQQVNEANQLTLKLEDLSGKTALDFGPIEDYDGDSVTVETLLAPSFFSFSKGVLGFNSKALMASGQSSQEVTYGVKLMLSDQKSQTQYQVFFVVPIKEAVIEAIQTTNTTNQTSANQTNSTQQEQVIQTGSTKADRNQISSKAQESQYQFVGVVIGQNFKIDESAEPPYWKSITVSNTGEVKIFFSEKLIRPSNITAIDSRILDVAVIPGGSVDQRYLGYSWWVTSFTESYFTIQLDFKDSLYVSSSGKRSYEKVQVKSKEINFFTSSTSFKPIKQEQPQRSDIPPQLSSNRAANNALELATSSAQSASKTVAVGAFVLNLVLSASLQLLWGMINALQIIGNLPLFNVYIPASAQVFFKVVTDLAKFDIIPSRLIIEWLLQNDSNNIFKDLGPLFLMMFLGAIFLVILVLLYCYRNSNGFFGDLYDRIYYLIFWNSTIRFILEGYLELALSSFLAWSKGLDWSTTFTRLASLFTLVTLIVIIVVPIVVSRYLHRNHSKFRDGEFLDRFNEVIGDLSYRSNLSPYFLSVFCYRRLFQVILIVYCQDYAWLQIMVQVTIGLVVVTIFGYISAKQAPSDRRLEYFNDTTIMLCVYHLFIFTDFVDDPIARFYAGYSLIGFTCLNILINIYLLLRETFKTLIFKIKKYGYGIRNKRIKKRSEKQKAQKRANQKLSQKQQLESSNLPNQNASESSKHSEQNSHFVDQQLEVISELPSELEGQSDRSVQLLKAKVKGNLNQVSSQVTQYYDFLTPETSIILKPAPEIKEEVPQGTFEERMHKYFQEALQAIDEIDEIEHKKNQK